MYELTIVIDQKTQMNIKAMPNAPAKPSSAVNAKEPKKPKTPQRADKTLTTFATSRKPFARFSLLKGDAI